MNKEKPMKVTEKYVHREREYFEECSFTYVNLTVGNCPNCGEDVNENYNYCPECGQHLDWSDK